MSEQPTAIPGVRGIHHVAFAVPDLDAGIAQWQTLGAQLELRKVVDDQGVDAASLEWPGGHGATLLELIAPVDDASGVAKFLDKRGPGMHHVAWAVADVQACLDAFTRAGARVIDAKPRRGLHGTPVAFVHPSSTGGVLTELVEVPST